MKLVIDLSSNTIAGGTNDPVFAPTSQQVLIDAPENFDMASASEWSYDGAAITRDPVAALDRAKAARKVRIKADAARLIESLDWELTRAREREAAGWATLSDIDAVLAERESIRQSSTGAEATVDAMTDAASVLNFTWSVDVAVPVPRRLTLKQLMDRFTQPELDAILAAVEVNAAMKQWWVRFEKARDVSLDDPATQAGVQALEIAGLIGAGRAGVVLA